MKHLRVQIKSLMFFSVVVLAVIVTLVTAAIETNRQAVYHALRAKDAFADILPAPLYLVDLRIVAANALRGRLTHAQAKEQRDAIVAEYDKTTQEWRASGEIDLKSLLLGQADAQAREFIRAVDATLAQVGKPHKDEEIVALVSDLNESFTKHRREVEMVAAQTSRMADEAHQKYLKATQLMYVGCLSLAVVVTLATLLMCAQMNARYKQDTGADPVEIVRIVTSMRDGHLGNDVIMARRAAAGSIMGALLQLARGLGRSVTQMKGAVATIGGSMKSAIAGAQQVQASVSPARAMVAAANEDAQQMGQMLMAGAGHLDDGTAACARASVAFSQIAHDESRCREAVAALEVDLHSIAKLSQQMLDSARRSSIVALNASVEATRASGQANGFKAVAKDMQLLSASTSSQASEVQIHTKRALGRMREVLQARSASESHSLEVQQLLARVAGALEQATGSIAQPMLGVQTIAERLQSVGHGLDAAVDAAEASLHDLRDVDLNCIALDGHLGHFRGERKAPDESSVIAADAQCGLEEPVPSQVESHAESPVRGAALAQTFSPQACGVEDIDALEQSQAQVRSPVGDECVPQETAA